MTLEAEIDFGLSLLKKSDVTKSVVISPISIDLALALVHAGAEGGSKEEIQKVIAGDSSDEQLLEHYKEASKALLKSTDVVVKLANRMFISNDFKVKQKYLDHIQENFAAMAVNLDFGNPNSSSKTVNDFVEEVTSGKIQNLVSSDDFKDALCFLVNAIYFAGEWDSPFGAKCDPDDFYVEEGLTKKIPYMKLCDVRRSYAETEEVQVLSLAYKDPGFQFVVVLPKEKFGLSAFRDSLTAEKLLDLIDRVHLHRLEIFIPKFKIEKETPLTDVLKELGVAQIFDDFKANLKQIADGIVVSWIRHKAFIEVDEKGTKAAAATVVKMRRSKGRTSRMIPREEEMITFRADHPFLFFIVNEHREHRRMKKNIVFSGQFNS